MVDVNSKVYPQITEFGGINTGAAPFNIGDNESTDERNLGSDNYPSISQWKEAEEFPGNDEFKEILYIGYLFDGDIFCIGTKVEDVGIAKEGHCYIYKYKDGVWKKFISKFTDARGNNQSTSEGIKIGNKKICAANWNGNRTVISPGVIWEREVEGISTMTVKCVFYVIGFNEEKNSEGNIVTKYWINEQINQYNFDTNDATELAGTINYMQVKDNRLITGSESLPNMAVSEYGKYRYDNVDDIAVFETPTEKGENCTGLAIFNDTILYFKRNATYILYGKTPDSYYLDTLSRSVGCVAGRSIAEANGALIWLGSDGIYAYSATTRPYKISQKVQKYIDNIEDEESACATSDGSKYYLSIKQKSGEYIMLMFDSERGVWHVWDNPGYTQLLHGKDGKILGLCDNKIYTLFQKANESEWKFISKPFDVGGASRGSNIYRLFLNVFGKAGARIEVSISGEADGDSFKTLFRKSFPVDKREKLDIKIAPCREVRDLKYFRLKISGKGECEVYGIDVYMRVKGRSY